VPVSGYDLLWNSASLTAFPSLSLANLKFILYHFHWKSKLFLFALLFPENSHQKLYDLQKKEIKRE